MHTMNTFVSRQRATENGVDFERLTFETPQQALEYLLPKIRSKSRRFYEREIINELNNRKSTIVDRHAGNGIYYVAQISNL